jgi:hypothetical protein
MAAVETGNTTTQQVDSETVSASTTTAVVPEAGGQRPRRFTAQQAFQKLQNLLAQRVEVSRTMMMLMPILEE